MREGVLRHQYIRRDGSLRDTVMYSIVPREWPAVKAKLEARLAAHAMNAKVTQLSIAPVKGMRLAAVERLELDAGGARGDRAFCVVDAESSMLLTSRTPALLQVVPRWEDGVLALRFPDGSEVAEPPALGARASTRELRRPPGPRDARRRRARRGGLRAPRTRMCDCWRATTASDWPTTRPSR